MKDNSKVNMPTCPPRSEQRIPQPTSSSCYLIGFTPAVERAKIIYIAKRDGAWRNQFC